MSLKRIYIGLCIVGTVLPFSQFIPWAVDNGLNVSLFVSDLFANDISGFFAFDVVVSAVVLTIFIVTEGKRLGMQKLWMPMVATFTIGVSCGLPLFLLMREHVLEQSEQ